MKENQTKGAICPRYGRPHEVAAKPKFLYWEEWWGSRPYIYTSPTTLVPTEHNPFNITEEEWKASEPTQTQMVFLRELNRRVEALEAALAKKGGSI